MTPTRTKLARACGTLGLAALAIAASPIAFAAEPGFYAGFNVGESAATIDDERITDGLLAQGATPGKLAEFGSTRDIDRRLTVGLTDTMARIFTGDGPAQALLGLSLGLLDTVAPARTLLAELMMFGRR